MPLVKKQSGWFWGSKGPFSSKAQALAVARAAYAHGYKGEGEMAHDFKQITEDMEKSSRFQKILDKVIFQ